MNKMASVFALSVLAICGNVFAADYFIDPAKGTPNGNGSKQRPWKTLEGAATSGKLKGLKGGDTVYLADGYHGDVTFSGENSSMVTIAAAPGARPKLSRLVISSGKNWTVKGLVISPSFGKAYKDEIVTFGESGESSKLVIEDCYIFTAEDASKWDAKQWLNANNGVYMGQHGKNLTLRNCFIRNTRFGIQLAAYDSVCEGNVVSDFSADGLRATRDGETVRDNIIKNVYLGDAEGDANHDDGIQVFLFNVGSGTVRKISMIGNIIIAHEDPQQKFQNALQGMGFFDGPLIDFVVKDNVVNVDQYHGISLYDAENAKVEGNVVWSPEGSKMTSWIMMAANPKSKHVAKDNVVKNNYAPRFKLKDGGVSAQDKNEPVTKEIYEEALKKRYKEISDKYGAKHFAADREKLEIK
jgi:polygalacturonase